MPLYEYRCEEDGDLITLLRSMAEADDPVEDPLAQGRTFHRVHSLFSVDRSPGGSPAAKTPPPSGGCCGGGCGCGS